MESGGASPMPMGNRTTMSSAVPSGLSNATTANTTTSSAVDPTKPRRAKICVYCGAHKGNNPIYMEAARELARVMAAHDIGLVYGGGTVGLMGELARTLVSLAGPDAVHGIIPEALVRYERDPSYTSSSTDNEQRGGLAVPKQELFGKTTVVNDMHTRKRMMAQEVLQAGPGSGFLAMSGGYGTFEELLETCTWNQLGIHDKGVCVLNVNGFYDGLFSWIRTSVREGFISEGNAHIIAEATSAEDAIHALREYQVSPSVLKLTWDKE